MPTLPGERACAEFLRVLHDDRLPIPFARRSGLERAAWAAAVRAENDGHVLVTRTTLERWRRAVVACATGDSDQPLDDLADVAA